MKKELEERLSVIDNSLNGYLPVFDNPQSVIYEAMRYSVFAGGKRLRPILMWETAKMLGKDWEDIKPFACALEMIHTYSLIHDDLPAMDNDDLRRGMPTSHIKFGEDIAILAGDALLNKAFEIIADTDIEPKTALKALKILSTASGSEGMIGGQVVDLKSEGQKITLSQMQYIHLLKTGALIRAACNAGAMVAGANEAEAKAIDEYALNLGIAFQIQDDILDVTGNREQLGKPIGSDADSSKNTYTTMCGLDRSKVLVAEFSDKAKEALTVFSDKAEFLLRLTDYLINRKN